MGGVPGVAHGLHVVRDYSRVTFIYGVGNDRRCPSVLIDRSLHSKITIYMIYSVSVTCKCDISLSALSFDHSWRLWDLETKTEILHQASVF